MSKLQIIVHGLGLACLGGAIGLQILLFLSILRKGYFHAIETNAPVLCFELVLTGFAAAYFLYVCQREIRSHIK